MVVVRKLFIITFICSHAKPRETWVKEGSLEEMTLGRSYRKKENNRNFRTQWPGKDPSSTVPSKIVDSSCSLFIKHGGQSICLGQRATVRLSELGVFCRQEGYR